MNMFTEGQKLRMQAALNTQRTGLLTSSGCIPPINLPVLEAKLETLLSPTGEICPSEVNALVYVRNLGQNEINSLSFEGELNGQNFNFDWTGSLLTGAAEVIEIPTLIQAIPGNNNISINIIHVNGTTDADNSNNQETGSFNIYNGNYMTMLEEGFEGTFPPQGWSYQSSGTNGTDWIKSNSAAASGNSSMKGDNWGSPAIILGPDFNYIYLPRIDLEGASNPVISFDLAYKLTIFANPDLTEFNADFGDLMAIEVSTDCGTTFQSIFNESGEGLATVLDTIIVPDGQPGPALNEHTIEANDWNNIQLSLADYIGEKIIIRFLNVGISQPIYVDNINLIASQVLTSDFQVLNEQTICVGGEVDYDFTGFGATTYSWTFEGGTPQSSTEENPIITYNQSGVYNVTLTVSDGTDQTTTTQTDYITVLTQPTAVISQNNSATSITSNDGSIQAEVFDGVAPYTFELLPDNIINTSGLFDNLPIGDYSVAIYNDDAQCFVEIPFSIDVILSNNNLEEELAQISISPNPGKDQFNLVFSNPFTEAVELSLLNVLGQQLRSEFVEAGQAYQDSWDVSSLSSGIYFLKVKIKNQTGAKKIIIHK